MPAKKPRGGGRAARSWDLKDIQRLIDLAIERGIDELEIETDGLRVRIKRGGSSAAIAAAAPGAVPFGTAILQSPAAPMAAANQSGTHSPAPVEESVEEGTEELHIVKSPIVGTFYNAPAPDAPPFVKSGDVVKMGQVLCIIEAMKLMNEIESDVGGEIVRIYVESGQPVEYGQSLFAIKPSHKR